MMLKTVKIVLIVDNEEHCQKCEAMKNMIDLIIMAFQGKLVLLVKELHWEEREAISLGDKYNLFEIPACIIGNNSFCGEDYSYDSIINAIECTEDKDVQ